MIRKSFSNCLISTVIIISSCFCQLAFADADTQNLVGGYGKPMAEKYIFGTKPYDLKQLTDGGAVQGQLFTQPFLSALTQQLTQLKQPTLQDSLVTALTAFNADMARIEALTAIPEKKSGSSMPTQASLQTQKSTGVAVTSFNPTAPPPIPIAVLSETTRLDIGTLLNPLTYSKDQTKEAQNFITWSSGLGNPVRTIDFSRLLKVKDPGGVLYTPETISKYLLNKPNVVNYLVALRTYVAELSVGLSNLYHIYEERLPIDDATALGKQLAAAGTPANPSELKALTLPTSVAQVQQYLATRRVADGQWYAQMLQATPIELQRQMLFLLAEMQAQQFRTNMELERLNATLSVMELQNAANAKTQVEQDRQKLEAEAPFKAE
jgi:hypothetical protein